MSRPLQWDRLVEVRASSGWRSERFGLANTKHWCRPRVTAPVQDASRPNLRDGQVLGVQVSLKTTRPTHNNPGGPDGSDRSTGGLLEWAWLLCLQMIDVPVHPSPSLLVSEARVQQNQPPTLAARQVA